MNEAAFEDDEAEDELIPPTAIRVARRALALCAVIERADLEYAKDNLDAQESPATIIVWTNAIGIADELEPDESDLLRIPLGSLTQRQQINSMWRTEGLGVLAWALRLLELPPHDVLGDPRTLIEYLHEINDEARTLLINPTLRDAEEIQTLRKRLLAVHWRLRQYVHVDRSPLDFTQFARDAWFGPLDITDIRLIDGDLAIDDVPITQADPARLQKCFSIARERHRAANWLCGDDPLYSEIDTST